MTYKRLTFFVDDHSFLSMIDEKYLNEAYDTDPKVTVQLSHSSLGVEDPVFAIDCVIGLKEYKTTKRIFNTVYVSVLDEKYLLNSKDDELVIEISIKKTKKFKCPIFTIMEYL